MNCICRSVVCVLMTLVSVSVHADEPSRIINLWPAKPPGETKDFPPEVDTTKPNDKLVAGRRLMRIGNVTTPTIEIFRPDLELDTGAAVVICPGGGHHILAYDLEGTEVAQWLNSIGVTGIVLKYRVPARDPNQRWMAAVRDAQRTVSFVRSKATDWELDRKRIGICGFSAGGETAALTSLFAERQYESIDEIDETSNRPDFTILVYPGGLIDKATGNLRDYIPVTKEAPPMFFVHAFDDRVSVQNSLKLASALKDVDVSCELHLFNSGGHGYGLRKTEMPVTNWTASCQHWLDQIGVLRSKSEQPD